MTILFLLYRAINSQKDDARYYCFNGVWENQTFAETTGTIERICLEQGRQDRTVLYLKNCRIQLHGNDSVYSQNKLYVSLSGKPSLQPGNILFLKGTLCEFPVATNPGMFDRREYYKEKGIYYNLQADSFRILQPRVYPVQNLLYQIRDRLSLVYRTCLPVKESGIVSAMILGDKSLLDMNIQKLYQESGIGHLLAISGLHVSILGMSLRKLFKKLYLPEHIAIPVCIVLTAAYGQMTDFSISTSRAVIMMILLIAADLFERTYDGKNALALAAVIILLQKPFALFSCSFLLSFGAMAGIYLVLPVLEQVWIGDPWEQRRKRRKMHQREKELLANKRTGKLQIFFQRQLQKLGQMFLMSSAVQLTTLPVMLYFFFEIPLYGIVINLFVIPLASVLVILSFSGGVAGCIYMPLGKFILSNAYWLLKIYEAICRVFQKLPSHMLIIGRPCWWQLLLYYLILSGILAWLLYSFHKIDEMEYQKVPLQPEILRKKTKHLGKLLPAMCILLILPIPSAAFEITLLDVGQGDGIYIHTPKQQNILIDGGSTSEKQVGKYRILPFLKSRGIRQIDYMIATHADEDHINGLEELINMSGDGYHIRQLFLPDVADKDQSGYVLLRKAAEQKHIPVRYLSTGSYFQSGGVSFVCLNPAAGNAFDSANAESITLSMQYQNFSCLFTGDLEGAGEEALQNIISSASTRQSYHIPEHYTVLKVAHHGSKNSTGEQLLDRLKPECALISCGRKNRYGHPHKELLERLVSSGADIRRTDESGALSVTFRKGTPRLTGYLDNLDNLSKSK